ncbi:MAG: MFS transporter [Chthoniobacterales bacterium]
MENETKANTKQQSAAQKNVIGGTVLTVILAVSFSHLLNDTIQGVLPAIYPLLKDNFSLTFGQVGLITLAFQLTASLLQPVIGLYTDSHPLPCSLAIGMALTLIGLVLLSLAGSFAMVLLSAGLIGMGSSIFHPEASRIARLASGGRHGFAQSLFQVGGNAGSALGPLLAALIIVPRGLHHVAWFCLAAIGGIIILVKIGAWYKGHLVILWAQPETHASISTAPELSRRRIIATIIVLMVLIFSKYFYLASVSSYYTFYLIHKFGVSIQSSQMFLFLFLASVAVGTIIGGPLGDRYGRKLVIWISILGVTPFTLTLPHANLLWVGILTVPIGVILASAFSAILVYAQELLPGRVGLVSGLFFGFAFGMGGIGSAVLGELADHTGIDFVFRVCAFLPLLGLLTIFLPNLKKSR